MRVLDLIGAMEGIAPPALAEPWDNVGLILGDRRAELRGAVLLTIDLSMAVVSEARQMNAGAIVAYHPPIFQPMRALTADTDKGAALLACAAAGMAIYSPHTALDAAAGGVADWLIDQVATPEATTGAGAGRCALVAATGSGAGGALAGSMVKLVTFVPVSPPEVVEQVRSALAGAGAGVIGAYETCSFSTPGTGSFLGGAGARPAVGQAGRLEFVDEVRLEMVCPKARVAGAIAALRAAHPYEEPAFDVYDLVAPPRADLGPGRALTMDQRASVSELAARVKSALGAASVSLASNDETKRVSRIAVCPGSGESLLGAAVAWGAEVFITGEMKHHEVLKALESGCSVILAGHTETERGYLPALARRLNALNAQFAACVSREDRAPLRAV